MRQNKTPTHSHTTISLHPGTFGYERSIIQRVFSQTFQACFVGLVIDDGIHHTYIHTASIRSSPGSYQTTMQILLYIYFLFLANRGTYMFFVFFSTYAGAFIIHSCRSFVHSFYHSFIRSSIQNLLLLPSSSSSSCCYGG